VSLNVDNDYEPVVGDTVFPFDSVPALSVMMHDSLLAKKSQHNMSQRTSPIIFGKK
jgi:hypothetical protein